MGLRVQKVHQYTKTRMAIASLAAFGAVFVYPLAGAMSVSSPSLDSYNSDSKASATLAVKTQEQKSKKSTAKKQAQQNSSTKSSCPPANLQSQSGLLSADAPQLRKLAEYRAICGGLNVSSVSFFIPMPKSTSDIAGQVDYAASRLKEFAKFKVAPLVFMEPTNPNGQLSLSAIANGNYDTVFKQYFSALKSRGITDQSMGTWVALPEANIPVWDNLSPGVVSSCITRIAKIQKQYFPGSKASILLDSVTYPRSNDWSGGRAISHAAYLKNIPKGLIDSFGLQGLPWVSPANQGAETNGTPSEYLRTDLAIQSAGILGVKHIWVNTGTFRFKYTNSASAKVAVSNSQRSEILSQVAKQLLAVRAKGFRVSAHIFAEDKSDTAEATNWSYWSTASLTSSDAVAVLPAFANKLKTNGIELWVYDS